MQGANQLHEDEKRKEEETKGKTKRQRRLGFANIERGLRRGSVWVLLKQVQRLAM